MEAPGTNGKVIPAKPTPPRVRADVIPSAMRDLARFVLWRYTWKPDKAKWDKPPLMATGPGSSTDPDTWVSLDEALAAYRRGGFDGIGLAMADGDVEDALVAVDLDKCRDPESGILEPWAQAVVARFQTYTEVSPSGRGLHLFCTGRLSFPDGKQGRRRGPVEVYRAGHYMTLSTWRLEGTPPEVEHRPEALAWLVAEHIDPPKKAPPPRPTSAAPREVSPADLTDTELIGRASAAKNGHHFRDLWAGGDGPHASASEADLALCNHLAFWTGRDAGRMESLFNQSARGERGKWKDRPDYREQTIRKAIEGTTAVYDPTPRTRPRARSQAAPSAQLARPLAVREWPLGCLLLRHGKVRRTPAKVMIPIEACLNGERVYLGQITTVDSSRTGPARLLARKAGVTGEAAEDALVALAVAAVASLDAPRAEDAAGPTLYDVVARDVPPSLQLTHRSDRGLWSEALGRDVTRSEFTCYQPTSLLEACALASDAPEAGGRTGLVRAVQVELGIVWSDLVATLPAEADAGLGKTTMAAEKFRAAILAIWTRPKLQERRKMGADEIVTSASLISKIRVQAEQYTVGTMQPEERECWRQIHEAYSAWWRPYISAAGEKRVALGMKYELAGEVGVAIPGCTGSRWFKRLGKSHGCIRSRDNRPGKSSPVTSLETTSDVTDRQTGGSRIAILADDLVDDLLSRPLNDDSPEPERAAEGGQP